MVPWHGAVAWRRGAMVPRRGVGARGDGTVLWRRGGVMVPWRRDAVR